MAREALHGTGVRVASVATGFPAGQVSLEAKLRDTEDAVAAGADEIDMVISRDAFLAGDDSRVQREILAVKEACGEAHLKVILETAELGWGCGGMKGGCCPGGNGSYSCGCLGSSCGYCRP